MHLMFKSSIFSHKFSSVTRRGLPIRTGRKHTQAYKKNFMLSLIECDFSTSHFPLDNSRVCNVFLGFFDCRLVGEHGTRRRHRDRRSLPRPRGT